MLKKVIIMIVIFSLVFIIVFLTGQETQLKEELQEVGIIELEVETEEKFLLRAAGLVKTLHRIEKSPLVGGEIVAMNYAVGDVISKDFLLKIDEQQVEENIELAEKRVKLREKFLEQEEVRLAQAQAVKKLWEIRLLQAQSQVLKILDTELKMAEVLLEQEAHQFERVELLALKDAVDSATVKSGQLQLESAKLGVELAELQRKENLSNYELQIAEVKAILKEVEKDIERVISAVKLAKVELDLALLELNHARERQNDLVLFAPEGYIVMAKNFTKGEYIGAGQTAYVVIKNEYEIVIEVDERDFPIFKPGFSGIAVLESYREEPFTVAVERVSPKINSQRGTVEVFLRIIEEPRELKHNMAVSVEFVAVKGEI